jgi:hypothetical protein
MNKSYWIISPNVHNNASESEWKKVIIDRKKAYIGFGPGDSTGVDFASKIKLGDVILVAQGANRNKRCYLCGIVDSEARAGEEAGTPGYAQSRELKYTVNENNLVALNLDFSGCAYGDADRIPALYRLKPNENENDLRIASALNIAIQHKRNEYLMNNIKLTQERQVQIKQLWEKYKNKTSESESKKLTEQVETLIKQWEPYRIKIINDTLIIDDYTNTLENSTNGMPGGYLCNFLERTTRAVFGSSRPVNAENFEVKLNNDNTTYFIKSQKKEKASRQEAEQFFNENIKAILKNIVSTNEPLDKVQMVNEANYSAKQVLMKMAILDNLPDFLYIYSQDALNDLYDEFIEGVEKTSLGKNHEICQVAKNLLRINESNFAELVLLSRFLWKYSNTQVFADKNTPNVILYGPPGTGKTYQVRNSLDFICQGNRNRYELLQFHPSFAYEDFIEGIKPKGVSKDGNLKFELVNGVFKRFCIKAKKDPDNTYYFVVDEINRANLSSVFGETLTTLENDYRHDVKTNTGNANLIKTQYSTLIEDMISEDEKNKALAYEIIDGQVYFGVPNNVYFVGMMNDVDKSIDTFDLALRRRFKWIRKDCDYDVIEEETKFKENEEFSNIGDYKRACYDLNNYISNDLGLGKSYEFGHSFFMKMSSIAKRKEIAHYNIEVLFNLHLRPTLKEYLRAIFAESELDNKLSVALNTFRKPFIK